MLRTREAAPALTALAVMVPLLFGPSLAHAGWPNDPRVNFRVCNNNNPRYNVGLDTDGEGGAFMAWHDQRDYGSSSYDIYVQRLTDRGTVAAGWSAAGLAVCTATNDQVNVVVVSDDVGGAYVAWQDARDGEFDIYATRVTAEGTLAAGWPSNGLAVCIENGEQSDLRGVADGFGGLLLVWADTRNGNSDIYAQRIAPDGTIATNWPAGGRAMCTDAAQQTHPACAADGFGGVLAVWEDDRSITVHIYGQHLTAVANVATGWGADGNAFCTAVGGQSSPILVSDGFGGAVAAWLDVRTNDYDIYAVRMTSVGTLAPGWTADGVGINTVTGFVSSLSAAPDATGGAILAWADYRDGSSDIYAQRIDGSGMTQWTADGIAVCALPYLQDSPQVLADGVGGAIVAWTDSRSLVYGDIMGVRLTAAGTLALGWTATGSPISTADGNQATPRLTSDGEGGAIVAFSDTRGFGVDIYAQRIDRFGQLGVQPTITGVSDVPNDQGGQVKVSWTRIAIDSYPYYEAYTYLVLRSAPAPTVTGGIDTESRYVTTFDHGTQFYWELIGTVPSQHTETYSFIAPTTGDSVDGSNPMTAFMIRARNADDTMWWFSDPDSGYSVDNLSPATPAPFAGSFSAGITTLHWDPNQEADFSVYRLHRGTSSDFVPDLGNLISEKPDTGYVDTDGGLYVYKLAAVDVHGNQSAYAVLTPEETTGAPLPDVPGRLWLGPGRPNPTRGPVAFDFGLARRGKVTLTILDLGGREIRSLITGTLSAGEHHVTWEGADGGGRPVPIGLYFAELRSGGERLKRKLIVTR